ncbi:MAG TPA: tetratricopeptide repeat protein [Longimicrobiaceae bacterium]|nr:tetratricopeptide repeat protein [Longimicrobiaceae bacterium]
MSAQSMASSRSRRNARVHSDDVVLERALRFSSWAQANLKVLITVAVVVVALALAGVYAWYSHREHQREAATAFQQVEARVNPANPALAARDLKGFIDQYGGTVYGQEARIQLAQVHLLAGEPKQAVTALQGAEEWVGESEVGAQGALILAAAQAAAGQRDAAIATYLKVADAARFDYRKVDALQNAAELRAQANDFAGAAALYQRIVEMSPAGTPNHTLYEMRAAEATARAEAK